MTDLGRGLAIETSGREGSVALVDGETILAEATFAHGLKHAAGIVPMIDRLLTEQRWRPADLRQIFVSTGPGSFTGLRIGITVAKTLAMTTGARLVAVPTLAVLAENAPAEATHLIVVLDAKRDQIFTARFARTLGKAWSVEESARLDTLTAMLSRSPRPHCPPYPVHLLGEGIPYHRAFIPADSAVIVTAEPTWTAHAAVVARLGRGLACEGVFADPLTLTPLYVRRPEAEEKWEQRTAGPSSSSPST